MLSIQNLRSNYGQSRVLQGVNLNVEENQIVVLLGRNGMGKTTLIRSITQLRPPEILGGSITFEGQELSELPPFQVARSGIGLVPQERRIFNSLTVHENLTVAEQKQLTSQTEKTYDLETVYEIFPRLQKRQDHLGAQLSGGEQQMLAIGRALMTNPRLLLMDEPSEGLAPKVVQRLKKRIHRLREEKASILLVEQNLDLGLSVADHIFIIETGTIVWDGSPAKLQNSNSLQDKYLGVVSNRIKGDNGEISS